MKKEEHKNKNSESYPIKRSLKRDQRKDRCEATTKCPWVSAIFTSPWGKYHLSRRDQSKLAGYFYALFSAYYITTLSVMKR